MSRTRALALILAAVLASYGLVWWEALRTSDAVVVAAGWCG